MATAIKFWLRKFLGPIVWAVMFAAMTYFAENHDARRDLLFNMIQFFNPHLQLAFITMYWGFLLHRFDVRQVPVPYRDILGWEQNSLIPPYMQYAKWTLYLIGGTSLGYALMFILGYSEGVGASIFPAILYGGGLVYFIFYIRQTFSFTRDIVLNTFIPSRGLQFQDMFFLDIFTSFAKELGDFIISICHMIKLLGWSGADRCGSSWFTTVVSSVPLIVGLFQCLKLWCNPNLETHLMQRYVYNVMRSLMIILVMGFAELHNHVESKNWNLTWIVVWGTIFGCYSCMSIFWDIVYDWDLRVHEWLFSGALPTVLTCIFTGRKRMLYYVFIVADITLRVAWGARLSGGLYSNLTVSFILSFCELLRRMMWIPLRIEAELRARNILPHVGLQPNIELGQIAHV